MIGKLPEVGALMHDTARGLFGEFRARERGEIYLRPLGGGREWAVSPAYVRTATADERRRVQGRRA